MRHRAILAGALGLIHGLGLASALSAIGLPPGGRLLALGTFNVGVECGQALVVLAVWPLLWLARRRGVGDRVRDVGSALIGLAGVYWLLQRL